MHYYKKNLGDYYKKAGRLSILQHGVYTLLIDCCYDRETFPTMEEAIDWVWASSPEEKQAVEFVLNRFFECENGVYVQKRIKEELKEYQTRAEKNRQIAIQREAKRAENSTKRAENDTKRAQVVNESSPNHKPLTNNHKPETSVGGEPPPRPPDEKFEMYSDWQPDANFSDHLKRSAIDLEKIPIERVNEIQGEFVDYWMTRMNNWGKSKHTHSEWQHKLLTNYINQKSKRDLYKTEPIRQTNIVEKLNDRSWAT